MLKLTQIRPLLADFDGEIRRLQRTGTGVQKLGEFGSLAGRFVENALNGPVEFRCASFPLRFNAEVEGELVSNQKLRIDDRLTFDGEVGPQLNPLRGIFTLEDGVEVHLLIDNGRVEQLSVKVDGDDLGDQRIRSQNPFVYPDPSSGRAVVRLDTAKGVLGYGKLKNDAPDGRWLQYELFSGLLWVKNYEREVPVGPQLQLDFQKTVPCTRTTWNTPDGPALKVVFADGRVLTSEAESAQGVLRVAGLNSYAVGPLNNGQLEGNTTLFVDGKLQVGCVAEGDQLAIPDIPSLLYAVEGHPRPEEPGTLNGHCEFDFQNGLIYNGFFENDFLFCHKNAFSSCIRDKNEGREFNLTRFLNRVAHFDGALSEFQAAGNIHAKYKDGTSYTGTLNSRFLRDGKGQLLDTKGTFYLGSFKDDLFHGFGRLFSEGKAVWGVWENGVLKLQFDENNLNVNDLRDLDNLAEMLNGGMSLEEVQTTLALRKKSRQAAEGGYGGLGGQSDDYLASVGRRLQGKDAEALKQRTEQLAMVTIFHFKNGYAYHGRVVGSYILDRDVGDVITPQGERIRVRYKAMLDLNMGAFKSLDERHFYMFSYEKRMLGEVALEETAN